jgi:hypothetical protein
MAGVAVNGSTIVEVTKSDHVTYRVDEWNEGDQGDPNADPPVPPSDGYWSFYANRTTGAKINGSVSVPSSKLKIQGQNVAKIGDAVEFSWVASPAIPSNTYWYRYTATSATSGSGTGVITGGSVKGKLGGQSIALIGSEVEVLGVTTTVADGNTKINFSS